MITLASIETELQTALKQRDRLAADTLRALKTRIQNDQIAKGKELAESDILVLIRSEVKRRKEAAEAYAAGSRAELAQKENDELAILQKYLPAQLSDEQIAVKIEELIAANGWTGKDFGPAMGKTKTEFGDTADGATLSKILKEKLK
jgi:uncharacterized protein YqeY